MAIKVVVRTALQLLGAEVAEWIFELILIHTRVYCSRLNSAMTMNRPVCQLAASPQPEINDDS